MSSSLVPAAARVLALLRELAAHPRPVPAATLASALGLPRSSTYQLLAAMREQGFVTHYPESSSWSLGVSAFELGSAYLRHEPLERLSRPLLRGLVETRRFPVVAHLGVLHGGETLYLLKESSARPLDLVTDVGVRLPAALTATGRALLGSLPRAQVRALFPNDAAFVDRTGSGPRSLRALEAALRDDAERGYSLEVGAVATGLRSIALAARDRAAMPAAAIGLTFREADAAREQGLVKDVSAVARELERRLR